MREHRPQKGSLLRIEEKCFALTNREKRERERERQSGRDRERRQELLSCPSEKEIEGVQGRRKNKSEVGLTDSKQNWEQR